MRIVSHRKLKDFYVTSGHENSRVALERWYIIVQQFKEKNMDNITKEQYELALTRVEELLPVVDDNTPANNKDAVELSLMSDIVIAYEKEHYPIGKPTVSELIELSLEEKRMTQKQLAHEIGISPSRINDYISGRSEPSLKNAGLLCRILDISPSAMLGL